MIPRRYLSFKYSIRYPVSSVSPVKNRKLRVPITLSRFKIPTPVIQILYLVYDSFLDIFLIKGHDFPFMNPSRERMGEVSNPPPIPWPLLNW